LNYFLIEINGLCYISRNADDKAGYNSKLELS